jgi:SAM-dependent methyltransferase
MSPRHPPVAYLFLVRPFIAAMFAQFAPNTYSQRWFVFFHVPISDARTNAEADFVRAFAPLPDFRRIADVCCGMGRHTRALAKRGYLVTGIDRDSTILAKARELGGGPSYIQADVRDYQPESGEYDAVIIMGQSFGHFDAATNVAILGRLSAGLRGHGRMLLDLWNPDFFASHQGERDLPTADGAVRETKHVQDGRLFVHLSYPTGDEEDFEWQLFTPESIEVLASPLALRLIACCTDFDDSAVLSASKPRIQFVLERA